VQKPILLSKCLFDFNRCSLDNVRMSERTKYEIRLSDQARWFVDQVYPDQAAAEKAFKDHVSDEATPYSGVQLVRVWARADDMDVEKIVTQAELTPKSAPVRLTYIDEAPYCVHDDDYGALPARMMMARLLRAYLDHEGIIPSELIFSYDRGKRFMAGELIMSAVDRVATLQAKATGQETKKRRGEIWDQLNGMVEALKRVQKTKRYQALDTDALPEILETGRLLKHPSGLVMALVKILMRARTLDSKVVQILAWLEVPEGQEVEDYLDEFLAECLSSLSFWMDGKRQISKGANPVFIEKTTALFAEGRLPHSRDVIFAFFLRQLAGKQPLDRHKPEEEEVTFLALFHRVATRKGMIGGPDMAVALTRRYARSLKQGGESGERLSIKWLLEIIENGFNQLVYLLALSESELGEAHPDIIHQGLYALHYKSRSIDDFLPDTVPPKQRLLKMHGLHMLVEESDIEPETAQRLLLCLDRVVEKYLIDSALIDRIDTPTASLHDRAINLVEFCGSGVLWPRGQAMQLAQQRVVDHLKGASFIEKFTEDEQDPAQKERMIRNFYALMAKAGFKAS